MTETRKRTEWVQRTIDEAAKTVTFTHVYQTAEMDKPLPHADNEPLVFHAELLSEANRNYAILSRMEARIGDTMAKDAGTSIADKLAAARTMVEHYESGTEEWNLKASRKPIDTDALLAKLSPENLLAKMTPEQLAAVQALMDQRQANAQGAGEPQG